MVSSKARPALFAVLATAMLLASGTAGVAFAESPTMSATVDAQDDEIHDGEEIIESFRDKLSSLETVEFTRTTETTFNNETITNTETVAADLEDEQKRVETESRYTNSTTVWNGSSVTTYYPSEERVSEHNITGTTLLPRIEPLSNESMSDYDYAGTEVVDGQETYVLNATATTADRNQTDGEVRTTIYLNTETYFPVQQVSQMESSEFSATSTVTYENVTLNGELPDGTFELDLPDDVKDTDEFSVPEYSQYDSYENLTSNTSLSVPATELGEFSFERGTVVDGDNMHSATLEYTDGNESVSVSTSAEATDFDYEESDLFEAVDVGDKTGYLNADGNFTSLYIEDDQSYSVYGDIGEDTAIDVAEALLDQ